MNVVCENAPDAFCESLVAVGCCDYYDDGVAYVRDNKVIRRFADEYEIVDGIVYSIAVSSPKAVPNDFGGVGAGGGGVGGAGGAGVGGGGDSVCSRDSDFLEVFGKLLSREPIQLLHDISIQLLRMHRDCLTFTDIDIGDIAAIDGHYCVLNTEKVVTFERETGYGSLLSPVRMGMFKAPELKDIVVIPAVDAVHKNSAIWSIGMMFARCVLGIRGDDGMGGDTVYEQLCSRLYGLSPVVSIVRRCVHPVAQDRMLLVV